MIHSPLWLQSSHDAQRNWRSRQWKLTRWLLALHLIALATLVFYFLNQ